MTTGTAGFFEIPLCGSDLLCVPEVGVAWGGGAFRQGGVQIVGSRVGRSTNN